nr:UvrD-helicase domain-containing protein [Adlercreutzia sp. ZJ138]
MALRCAQRCAITSFPGSGKTQQLVGRVREMLEGGISPEDILVLCATPDSAQSFCDRLRSCVGLPSSDIAIMSVRSFALDVLAREDARAFTGREPRLLAPFEESVLFEDIKTSGLRTGRLKEMLKFFYRGLTELADEDPSWLINGEEKGVFSILKGSLSMVRGLLEPEISNWCVKYLKSRPGRLNAVSRKHVIVDDYQAISRASQTIALLIAEESICIAGDPLSKTTVYESFPFTEGLTEFLTDPEVVVERLEGTHRSASMTELTNALLKEPCFKGVFPCVFSENAQTGSVEILSFDSPEEELRGAAARVSSLVSSGINPSSVYIAAPNRAWLKNIKRALLTEGLAVDCMMSASLLGGDIRNVAFCKAARVFTALSLAVDPNDSLALRAWCGMGDHLANSPVFEKLRTAHEAIGIDVSTALDQLQMGCGDATYNQRQVIELYRESKRIASVVEGLKGMELLKALACFVARSDDEEVPEAVVAMCSPVDEGADAAELQSHVLKRLAYPSFAHDGCSVKLGTYEQSFGLDVDVVVLVGFVNGFFPSQDYFDATKCNNDQRERIRTKDTIRMYDLLGCARESVIATCFTEAELEIASALNLKVDRIRIRQGKRMCRISPSLYCSVMQQK